MPDTLKIRQHRQALQPQWLLGLSARCWFVGIAVVLGVACLPFDLMIAGSIHAHRLPGFIRDLVENTEPFGHAVGVIVLLLVLAFSFPQHQRRYLWIGLISLGAGLVTDLVKFSYGRVRPRDLAWDQVAEVTQTFTGWFPLLWQSQAHTSFPSGHTTVAFALAVCLSAYVPSGKWTFLGLAAFVGIGRVLSSAHYPSDVCFGAAVGWSVAWIAISALHQKLGKHTDKHLPIRTSAIQSAESQFSETVIVDPDHSEPFAA